MSSLTPPSKCLFFSSILYRKDLISEDELKNLWEKQFGESFTFTHPYVPMKKYYSKEMGDEGVLARFFILSPKLVDREILVESKLFADKYERETMREGKRVVNLDTGILTLENLQLATGKNFTHRIYLRSGVYSDLTLIYKGNSYEGLPWSYPDYQGPEVIEFFNFYRTYLHLELKRAVRLISSH